MEIRDHLYLLIQDSSQVSDARRQVALLAKKYGFSAEILGRIALVVTECATNLLKHTSQGGVIICQLIALDEALAIDILALDKGPGIANVTEALRDGFSTARSPGTGLGAIARLSDSFDIYSILHEGTAILSRIWVKKADSPLAKLTADFGAINIPIANEPVSGDSWAMHREQERILLTVVDGLGHGPGAAAASQQAIKTFKATVKRTPVEIVKAIHVALQGTRGAAVGIALIDIPTHKLTFAGVGNIEGAIYVDEHVSRFVSHNGTAGYEIGHPKEFSYDCPDGAIVVLSSDGCTSQINLNRYTALKSKDAALIAGVLYRDFNRGRDDASVIVLKTRPATQLSGG